MSKHDIIENFCFINKESDMLKFKVIFIQMCKENEITKDDFIKWQNKTHEFIINNPTLISKGALGIERAFLVGKNLDLPK